MYPELRVPGTTELVETPVKLTSRQKELLEELEGVSLKDHSRHSPRAKSWMDKAKDFFAD